MINDLPLFPLDHLPLFGEASATALKIRDRSFSYEELNLRIGRLAAWLQSHGFKQGDRVATWLTKGEIACIMPLAAARARLVHVPINPLLKAAQVQHIMDDSSAVMLVTNGARASSFDFVDEKHLLAILDDEQADVAPRLPADMDTGTLAAILYTSGSTGRPKGVMLSHANLVLGAQSVAQYLKLRSDDVTLAVLPLSFDYGQNQLLSTWRAGGTVVPLDYLTARDVIKACSGNKITTLAAVPPLWVQLVEQCWPDTAVHGLRRLTNSGGALTQSLVKSMRAAFGSTTDIYAMYGLTEAFRSTYLAPELIDANPTSIGKAIPFAEIMVVAPDGSKAAPDQPGELVHAGPLVAQGYWQDNPRTAERFKPAPDFSKYGGVAVWSGDTVRRDTDGLLYFVSRDDAMIKTIGNRVSPTEVEEAAIESGQVAEACALGYKDERLGEAIILCVRGSGDDAELKTHMKTTLPNFMQPSEIIWLPAFPKSANGKLDRNLLALWLAA